MFPRPPYGIFEPFNNCKQKFRQGYLSSHSITFWIRISSQTLGWIQIRIINKYGTETLIKSQLFCGSFRCTALPIFKETQQELKKYFTFESPIGCADMENGQNIRFYEGGIIGTVYFILEISTPEKITGQ